MCIANGIYLLTRGYIYHGILGRWDALSLYCQYTYICYTLCAI